MCTYSVEWVAIIKYKFYMRRRRWISVQIFIANNEAERTNERTNQGALIWWRNMNYDYLQWSRPATLSLGWVVERVPIYGNKWDRG